MHGKLSFVVNFIPISQEATFSFCITRRHHSRVSSRASSSRMELVTVFFYLSFFTFT